MTKTTIGIPRGLFYEEYGYLWKCYLEKLGLNVKESIPTNKEIIRLGNSYATSEMCFSLKITLGHIAYLQNQVDYILLPRIDNFGIDNQTCTNFLLLYDLAKNIFSASFLSYNINELKKETEEKGFMKIGKQLGKKEEECKIAYQEAKEKEKERKRKKIKRNKNLLEKEKKKILLLSHPYNLYDPFLGEMVAKKVKKRGFSVLYSDAFEEEEMLKQSQNLSKNLYWYESRKNMGALMFLKNKIDGIIFLTTFPCGLDSLVNELAMRKESFPYLNLIMDDSDAFAGMDTRIESFLDILELQR